MAKEHSISPYPENENSKKKQIIIMFNGISKRYDFFNRVISLGIDQGWRRKIVKELAKSKPSTVLDIATGTGDLAISLVKTKATKIVGLDISPGMLSIGKKKVKEKNLSEIIEMVEGDSENLPYDDAVFDAVTVGFGVRNFEELEKGLAEIFRVMKSGGKLAILETAVPQKFPFKQGYTIFYRKFYLSFVARFLTKDKAAYEYLSNSAAIFPCGKEFNNILEKIGFIRVEDKPQTLGVVSIYYGTKS